MDNSLNGFEMPNLDIDFTSKFNEAYEASNREMALRLQGINDINIQKQLRETENNESLKSIANYNKEILNHNKELVSLNEKILKKINSLDDTLLFLNNAFIDKSNMDKENNQNHNALLLELINIIDSKDEGKLNQFINGIAAPVGAGLIVEYLKIKLGLI